MTLSIDQLEAWHRIEEICEPYGIFPIHENNRVLIRVDALSTDILLGDLMAEAIVDVLVRQDIHISLVERTLQIPLSDSPSEARHLAHGLAEALYSIRGLHPARFLSRYGEGSHIPEGDRLSLPRSESFHQRLLQNDFIPDDKKPPVLDLFRSQGPYLASIDDDRLSIFDAAGQIATHAAGLNPATILEAFWMGRFGRYPIENPDTTENRVPELLRLASTLRHAAGPELPHVTFCGSGAEANELALRIAARQRPGCRRILAFEGSFHGRTMAVLHATWNPKKRLRFELDGHQAAFCPWPTGYLPTEEREDSDDLLGDWDQAIGHTQRAEPKKSDTLLHAEWESLTSVEKHFESGEITAIFVEPMQSEGGEHHASPRFFSRLRALALCYSVPFIVDEVQTGFCLGGPFFWHRIYPLSAPPDLITVAKKAQVGAVISRWPINVPEETHVTSAIRGQLQANIMGSGACEEVESDMRSRLAELAKAHPDTVLNPRCRGFAFGFDLPDAESRNHLISERLWRGYLLYGAGERAIRFRFHPGVTPRASAALFERLDASLTSLEQGDGTDWRQVETPDPCPSWPPTKAVIPSGYTLIPLDKALWLHVLPHIRQLQETCYEPARRDDLDAFTGLMDDPHALCFIAVKGHDAPPAGELVGTAFAFPLEYFSDLDGPAQDPTLGQRTTLYSADITVHPDHRGLRLGLALKEAQISAAIRASHADGSLRFSFATGRNRVGATDAIQGINTRFGAYEVARYSGQYGEENAVAAYYRIPLSNPRLPNRAWQPTGEASNRLRFDLPPEQRLSGVDTVRANLSSTLSELLLPFREGVMNGAVNNKLSLCNFVTPGVVRAMEMLRAIAPNKLGHLVVANSRAETCDKGLRAIKFHRPEGQAVVGYGPVWAGESTAAARSISLPEEHPENWFGWANTPDPCASVTDALDDLKSKIEAQGADTILAVVTEAVFRKTARKMPEDAWVPLRELTAKHGIPLILLETASGGYRNASSMWRADALPICVDALWWYASAQLGLIYLSDALYVAEKLTLISTWDGDEVALTRLLWELRALRRLPLEKTADELHRILQSLGQVEGEGLYLSVQTKEATNVQKQLARADILVGCTDDERLLFVPPLNLAPSELQTLETAIANL